jgi:hypothetical protein
MLFLRRFVIQLFAILLIKETGAIKALSMEGESGEN